MTTISVCQLRNDVSAVLRRAEEGEVLTVTVNGRPAARIMPLTSRPSSMPWSIFWDALDRAAADADLAAELAAALPETTDEA
jgi:prevent-host-death family protein